MPKRLPLRHLSRAVLPWAPPTLDSPRVVTVTDDKATRIINLSPGEDCLILMPDVVSYVPNAMAPNEDGIVTVTGGRNVTVIGGEFDVDRVITTTVTVSIDANGTTLTVSDTSQFPPSGFIRVDGEGMLYDSKTATSFHITDRRFGFYLGTGTLPDTPHSSGAVVYLGEYHRTAVSFRSQTGFVHAEGLRIEGDGLLDGFRVRGTSATTVSIQNTFVGPVGPVEIISMQDGHADCIQTWGSGVKNLRLSHLTMLGGVSGRCLINAADTSGGGAVEKLYVLDSEFVDFFGRRQTLVTNSDEATEWLVANSWLRTAKTRAVAAPEKGHLFGKDFPDGRHLIDPAKLGRQYVSPGYA